jgi:hypothetical protein
MRPLGRGSAEERRTPMAKGCLFPESEFDGLRKEMKGKDDLLRQKESYYELSGPHAHMKEHAHPGNCPKSGARLAKRDRTATPSVEKIESIAEEHVEEYSLA